MEQKPEALRLANLLDFAKDYDHLGIAAYPAAAELCRLQAENESLREQNTLVDQACARLETENEALRKSGEQAISALELAQTDVHWELNSPTRKALRKAEVGLRAAMKGQP